MAKRKGTQHGGGGASEDSAMTKVLDQHELEREPDPEPMTDENIFVFIPNIIGYTRIILAAVSLTYMSYHPIYCTLAYTVSCLLDAVDGQAARYFNQMSRFGAVLDMVTDRCTTSCLLCFLSSAYPRWALFFQFLITLDFSSHYIHMYSSLVTGQASHKSVTKKQSRILWSYYNKPSTLFFYCAGNELFFVCLYLMHYYHKPIGFSSTVLLPHLPRFLISKIPGLVWGGIELVTWPQMLALITFPICAVKQGINCVQFWKAAKQLCDRDRAERWKKLESREEIGKA